MEKKKKNLFTLWFLDFLLNELYCVNSLNKQVKLRLKSFIDMILDCAKFELRI